MEKKIKVKCEDGVDVRKYVNDIFAMVDELVYHDITSDKKTIAPTIINALPKSYKYIEDFYIYYS